MSEEQLKAFLEKVKTDTSLKETLKAASDADAVVAIAKEAGFSISADDLKKAQSELSDEELEGATGGTGFSVFDCLVVLELAKRREQFQKDIDRFGDLPLPND